MLMIIAAIILIPVLAFLISCGKEILLVLVLIGLLIYSPLDFLGEIVGRLLLFGLVIGAIKIISSIFEK